MKPNKNKEVNIKQQLNRIHSISEYYDICHENNDNKLMDSLSINEIDQHMIRISRNEDKPVICWYMQFELQEELITPLELWYGIHQLIDLTKMTFFFPRTDLIQILPASEINLMYIGKAIKYTLIDRGLSKDDIKIRIYRDRASCDKLFNRFGDSDDIMCLEDN